MAVRGGDEVLVARGLFLTRSAPLVSDKGQFRFPLQEGTIFWPWIQEH
jgi:hypothetical protein